MPTPPPVKPSPAVHAAWRQLLTAHARATQAVGDGLVAAGVLPMERYDLLLVLLESPRGRRRLTDIADALLFTRGGITRLVTKLESEGLVRIEASRDDARSKYAVLTAKGERALKQTWAVYEPLIQEHFARHLDEASTAELLAALRRLPGVPAAPSPVTLSVKGRPLE